MRRLPKIGALLIALLIGVPTLVAMDPFTSDTEDAATPPLLHTDPDAGTLTHLDAADDTGVYGTRTLAYTTADGALVLRDRAADGSLRQSATAIDASHDRWSFTTLSASSDHHSIVAGTEEGHLVVWLADDDGHTLYTFDTAAPVTATSVTHDGDHFAAANLKGDVWSFTRDRFLRDGQPIFHDRAERPHTATTAPLHEPVDDALGLINHPEDDTPARPLFDDWFSTRPLTHLEYTGQARNALDPTGLVLVATTAYAEVLAWDLQRVAPSAKTLDGGSWSHRLAAAQCATIHVGDHSVEEPCHRGAAARLVERLDAMTDGEATLVTDLIAQRLRAETRLDPVLGLVPGDAESRTVHLGATQGVSGGGAHLVTVTLATGDTTAFEVTPGQDAPLVPLWSQALGSDATHADLSAIHRTALGRGALLATATSDGATRVHLVRAGFTSPVLATQWHPGTEQGIQALALAPADPDDATLTTPALLLAVATEDGHVHTFDPRPVYGTTHTLWRDGDATPAPVRALDVTRTGAVVAGGAGLTLWGGPVSVRIVAADTAIKNQPWTASTLIDAPDSTVDDVYWTIEATETATPRATVQGASLTHVFPAEDRYRVTVVAVADNDLRANATLDVVVGGLRPVIRVSAPDMVPMNSTFTFDLNGTHDPDAPEGTLGLSSVTVHPLGNAQAVTVPLDTLRLDWNYTDATGQYLVVVRAVDLDGRTAQTTRWIQVTGAGYEVSPDPAEPVGTNRLRRIAQAPDGMLLAYGGDRGPAHTDVQSGDFGRYQVRHANGTILGQRGAVDRDGTGGPIVDAAWLPDSSGFVLARGDGTLVRGPLDGKGALTTLASDTSPLRRVFASDGYDRILGVHRDGTVTVAPRALDAILERYVPDTTTHVLGAWSDPHADLLVLHTSDDRLVLFDVNRLSDGPLDEAPLSRTITTLAGAPNLDTSGRAWLYAGHSDGTVTTLQVRGTDLVPLGNVQHDNGRRVQAIHVTPIDDQGDHGITVATRSTNELCAGRHDVPCGFLTSGHTDGPRDGPLLKPARKVELPRRIVTVASSDDQRQTLVLNQGGRDAIHRYDSTWNEGPVQRLDGFPSAPVDLTLEPDGGATLLLGDGRTAQLFAAPRAVLRIGPHDDAGAPQWGERVPIDTPVTFDASESRALDGQITSYRWDLGDGTRRNNRTFVHTFDDTGTYTVRLTVTARIQQPVETTITDHLVYHLDVWDPPPVALLDASPWSTDEDAVHVTSGDTVTFDARRSHDVGGQILTYRFAYGDNDGQTGGQAVRTHVYKQPGTYWATVTIHDDDHFATTSEPLRVIVDNRPPVAAFGWTQADSNETPDQVKAHVPFTLDARTSSDPDGKIIRYRWTIDGEPVTTGATTTHTFTTLGAHNVTLEVTDDHGATDTLTRTLLADDGIQLRQTQDPPSGWQIDPTDQVTVHGSVTDLTQWPDPGAPVMGAEVTIRVYYDGALGSSPATTPYETVTKTTDIDGGVHHEVGKNGGFTYQAGRYRVTMTAALYDSALGDTEYTETMNTVFIVEP